ncbi:Rof/RNase P-like protein [Russula brevipes]|nr:Rof/RNase P-like protein [Russula brevipes]
MGRREAAEKGVWRLREEEARWDAFVPLHRLWLGYMSELLGLAAAPEGPEDGGGGDSGGASSSSAAMSRAVAAGMHAKLLKADFHGSIVTGYAQEQERRAVGTSGIVVQETENTFKVVTRKDKLKVLPKQGSVFAFAVPLHSTEAAVINSGTNDGEAGCGRGRTVQDGAHIELELYGNQFRFRAADRAGRKFKHKESIVL